jgi:hypothetical protein
MTEQEIIELYEERLAIMTDGNSKDLEWFDTNEVNKRLQRAAFFDTRRVAGATTMPKQIRPDQPAPTAEPPIVTTMRRRAEHIDFGFLSGAIRNNQKALPSNIDGVYERRGRFLVLEFKRPGEQFGIGQEILLKALAAVETFQVWIVTGTFKPGSLSFERAERLLPTGLKQIVAESLDVLKLKINAWHDAVGR